MTRMLGRLTYANVMVTVLALVALGGGTAFAASQLERESVGTGALKKEAVTPAKLSKKAKSTLTGPTGPRGATGPQGETGARGEAGVPATSLTAHVSATDKLIGGSGVTRVVPVEKAYAVEFDRDVSGCNFQVTLERSTGGGSVIVGPFEGNPNAVIIEPLDSTEGHTTRAFYLAVLC
ncbi:MAG TPA: hypothetical protein VGG40_09175 [Solirubrobacterales bacterium]|jgi:hypothetical protein